MVFFYFTKTNCPDPSVLYRDNNVNYISVGDIDLLVSYFDSDRDGILTYNE
jgi:hypothetical protein